MSNDTLQWQSKPQSDQLASLETELGSLRQQLADSDKLRKRAIAQRASMAAELDDTKDALRETRAALRRVRSTARKLTPRKPKKAAALADPRKSLPEEDREILINLAEIYGQSPMLVLRRLLRERQADLRMRRDR